jgi:hypothetical protein
MPTDNGAGLVSGFKSDSWERSYRMSEETEAETQGAVASCKKMVIGEKAGEKHVERTIIPGQEAI